VEERLQALLWKCYLTIYVFRVWLQPNPLLGFEPDEEVWRDIEINGSHTLAAFPRGYFRRVQGGTPTPTSSSHATRRVSHLELRPPTPLRRRSELATDGRRGIGRFIDRAVPDDAAAEAKERFRDLQRNPRRKATPWTTVEELDPRTTGRALLHVRYGDGWEHSIDLQEAREGSSLDGGPAVVNEQGEAPPSVPRSDDDQ